MITDSVGNIGGPKVVKATTAMWLKMDEIIPLGIIAVEVLSNDMIRVKMGNGVNKYSELPYFATEYTISKVANWVPNVPYEKGNLVVYNGSLMMAITDVAPSTIFDESKWKVISSEHVQNDIDSKLPKIDANKHFVTGVSVTSTEATVSVNQTTYNMYSKTGANSAAVFPIASNLQAGAMPASAFNQLNENTSRIAALEGRVSFFLADFSSISGDPTQEELLALFKEASGQEKPFDGATLVREDNTSVKYRYYENNNTWQLDSTGGVGIASLTSLGVVSGSNEKGKIFVEADGSMSLNDYDAIIEGKTYPSAGLTTNLEGSEIPNSLITEAEVIKDKEDIELGDAADNILSLLVKSNNDLVEQIRGMEINGYRIDFDATQLDIQPENMRADYKLEKGPYTVTSPYATVEMYGNLVIFDEKIPGKGIIRTPDGEIKEVTDLGVYAPESSINVIHVLDANDNEVCYVINEKSQKTTLCFYPDGTYKTATCPGDDSSFTPQNISDVEILTSADGKRHSLFMYNAHPLGQAASQLPDRYILLQLEDCEYKEVNASTPPCDGNNDNDQSPLDLTIPFGNMRLSWEGHTDYKDYKSEASYFVDTTRADSVNGNKRLRFRTGEWQTMRGSVLVNKSLNENHNGVYKFGIGAQILWNVSTDRQFIVVTPEGFLGWFLLPNVNFQLTWREVKITQGQYAGKTALVFANEMKATKFIFFVNTHDGNPENTVCTAMSTTQDNLNHKNGKNIIEEAFAYAPNFPFTDGKRIYFAVAPTVFILESGDPRNHFVYLNVSEIAPNKYEGNTPVKQFDLHCLNTKDDSETGKTNLIFGVSWWEMAEYIDFGTSENPQKGLLVKSAGNVDMFFPDADDEWIEADEEVERSVGYWKTRPYFIERPTDEIDVIHPVHSRREAHWFKQANTCLTWRKHHFQAVKVLKYVLGEEALPTRIFDYYYSTETSRVVCKAIEFAQANLGLPIQVTENLVLFWNYDGSARAVALQWTSDKGDDEFTDQSDFTVTDGGDWNPTRGTTGLILYEEQETSATKLEQGYIKNLYFFDPGTVRNDYVKLAIKQTIVEDSTEPDTPTEPGEDIEQQSSIFTREATKPSKIIYTPEYEILNLPREMKVGNLIAYSNKRIILTTEGNDTTCTYMTIGTGQSLAVMYPDNCHLRDVYDITNPHNSNETADRAYALFTGDNGFFYVLERDKVTGIPQLTRYTMTAKVQGRLWALPAREVNGVKALRFAMGPSMEVNGTANAPMTIIERIGGTIEGDVNPSDFTLVRDFSNATKIALKGVPALPWGAPELDPHDNTKVRFTEPELFWHSEANYSNAPIEIRNAEDDECFLGFTDDYEPVYGQCYTFGANVSHVVYGSDYQKRRKRGVLEVTTSALTDAFIPLDITGNCPSYKISDDFEMTKEATMNLFTEEIPIEGGKKSSVWMIAEGPYDVANSKYWNYDDMVLKNLVVAVRSAGENPQYPTLTLGIGLSDVVFHGSTDTANGSGKITGFAFDLKMRKGHVAIRKLKTKDNESTNNPIICAFYDSGYFSGLPFITDGKINDFQVQGYLFRTQNTKNVPLFDLNTNSILAGITRRRNNQDVVPLSTTNIVPYQVFTDKDVSMVYADSHNAQKEGMTLFYDQVRVCHPRQAAKGIRLFTSREMYQDDTGTAIITCFFTNEEGVADYIEIRIPDAYEIIDAISYTNNKMELFATTKCWAIPDTSFDPERVDIVPLAGAVVYFDYGLELAMIRNDDAFNLHLYVPQTLAITYKGKVVGVINLKDLVLRGQTMAEYLSVVNTLTSNLIEANKIISQLITVNKAVVNELEVKRAEIENLHISGDITSNTAHFSELYLESKYPDVTY